MKRIFALMLSAVLASGFMSCADTVAPVPFDVATEKAAVAHVTSSDSPSAEGCYTNGDYGMEIICEDTADDGCTYNFILFSLKDGAQRFFGTCDGVFEYGKIFRAADMTDPDSTMVCTVREDHSLNVEYFCKGVSVVSASGLYTRSDGGVALTLENQDTYIKSGVYQNGEYRLYAEIEGDALSISITDADGKCVFECRKNDGSELPALMTEYNGTVVEICASKKDGKCCIEVAKYSGREEIKYGGMYSQVENNK
ncbi:MAG: hypothetical protein IJO77_04050 [Oscillospiraceae bacterium]|nr:hypothetical protein [Oscillospiraceae bacterium]